MSGSGWNRPTGNQPAAKKGGAKAPSAMKGVVAGLAVAVALGAVCYFMFSGNEKKPTVVKEAKKAAPTIKEVKPAAAPKVAETTAKPVAKPKPKPTGVNMAKLSLEEREAIVEKKMAAVPLPKASTNSAFRTITEKIMANIFSCQLGDMPPPLPNVPVNELARIREILELTNEIKESDSERDKIRKEAVQLAKKELEKFLADGGNVDEFLRYYRDQLKSAHETWKSLRLEAIKTVQNDPAAAPMLIHDINEKLAEKGIKPVEVPPPLLQKHGVQLLD